MSDKKIECPHYKTEGYNYELKGKKPNVDIFLCVKCNDDLLKIMTEQKALEKECNKAFMKMIKKRKRKIYKYL